MPFDSEPAAEVTARDRVIRLRDFLAEQVPDAQFDMRDWWTGKPELHKCGTNACIGGWANVLFFPGGERCGLEVGRHLGLDSSQSYELFFGGGVYIGASRTQAVAVLDHYLESGVIAWGVAE